MRVDSFFCFRSKPYIRLRIVPTAASRYDRWALPPGGSQTGVPSDSQSVLERHPEASGRAAPPASVPAANYVAMSLAPKSCVIICDLDGVIRYATFSACRLLGLSDYEAANHTVDEVAGKLSAKFRWSSIAAVIAGGRGYELDCSFVSPIGHRGSLHLHAHPVFDLDQRLSSTVIVLEVLPAARVPVQEKPSFTFADRYATTSLTYERGRELFLELDRVVRSEELFRTSRLTVAALAQKLSTNTQYLSHVINYFCNERFPNYINRLRIQWMSAEKRSRPRDDHAHLWREAGFGSYSAYHRAYKQIRRAAVLVS